MTYLYLPRTISTLSEAFRYFEEMYKNRGLAGTFGKHFGKEFTPCHFVTLTLRDQYVAGLGKIPLGTLSLAKAWRWFYHSVRHVQGHRFEFIMVIERQRRGVPHCHVLTFNTAGIVGHEQFLEEGCWQRFGRSRIEKFVPGKINGAAEYLGKYIGKDRTHLRFAVSRILMRMAASSSTGGPVMPCKAV